MGAQGSSSCFCFCLGGLLRCGACLLLVLVARIVDSHAMLSSSIIEAMILACEMAVKSKIEYFDLIRTRDSQDM